ncbi:MAG: helix-turn-helix domain-containing protein, partial [Solirubrobacteraceae bacterium]
MTGSRDVGETISCQLRRLRRLRGLTQEELADRANVSRDLVAKLEQGRRQSARIASLVSLARALNVELSALVQDATPLGNALTSLAAGLGATGSPEARAARRPDGFEELAAALVHGDDAGTVAGALDLAALTRSAAAAKRNLQACR